MTSTLLQGRHHDGRHYSLAGFVPVDNFGNSKIDVSPSQQRRDNVLIAVYAITDADLCMSLQQIIKYNLEKSN